MAVLQLVLSDTKKQKNYYLKFLNKELNIGGIKVFIIMMNESQKRILKLMGLNEEVSINSPSFEGLKIQKPTTQQMGGEFDVRDILQDDRNDMMRKQLFGLFDVTTIDDLMEIFDDINPTKISSVLTKIKNDKTSKEIYNFLKEIKRKMVLQLSKS
jgi:hypothetical protein